MTEKQIKQNTKNYYIIKYKSALYRATTEADKQYYLYMIKQEKK